MGALHVWSNNYIGKYTYIGYIESETQIKTSVLFIQFGSELRIKSPKNNAKGSIWPKYFQLNLILNYQEKIWDKQKYIVDDQ